MLIQCPRCGFSQPEDQYCAQCGVNMQSFKRKEKSFAKKFFENLGVQVSLLILVAILVGSYITQTGAAPPWAQKLSKFQGVSKSTKSVSAPAASEEKILATSETLPNESLKELTHQEISIETKATSTAAPTAAKSVTENSVAAAKQTESKDLQNDPSLVPFRLTYAEVSTEVLTKWVTESSRSGQFQSLQNYSAGILLNYKKRGDSIIQNLKTVDQRLSIGQTETNLSGNISDDGSQMIGLSVAYELKSLDTNTVHGSIIVTRSSRQGRESFPAEFDLPKGAVFYVVDTLNRQSFRQEKVSLSMAPFQILNSIDFNSQKSKFVIILEPELK